MISGDILFHEVFAMIDNALSSRQSVIAAIEGGSCSGKSTLASLLADKYDCNIFHMDDFFLQPVQRTGERFNEPGGNVDYERFNAEVIRGLKQGGEFRYQLYDCGVCELTDYVTVQPKKLNIIEGVYSMHPLWNEIFDIRIFLYTDNAVQLDRILKRNGEKMLERFRNVWIPLENKYFDAFNIRSMCDIVIDTGLLE